MMVKELIFMYYQYNFFHIIYLSIKNIVIINKLIIMMKIGQIFTLLSAQKIFLVCIRNQSKNAFTRAKFEVGY